VSPFYLFQIPGKQSQQLVNQPLPATVWTATVVQQVYDAANNSDLDDDDIDDDTQQLQQQQHIATNTVTVLHDTIVRTLRSSALKQAATPQTSTALKLRQTSSLTSSTKFYVVAGAVVVGIGIGITAWYHLPYLRELYYQRWGSRSSSTTSNRNSSSSTSRSSDARYDVHERSPVVQGHSRVLAVSAAAAVECRPVTASGCSSSNNSSRNSSLTELLYGMRTTNALPTDNSSSSLSKQCESAMSAAAVNMLFKVLVSI
jgi:hypothetical protein